MGQLVDRGDGLGRQLGQAVVVHGETAGDAAAAKYGVA